MSETNYYNLFKFLEDKKGKEVPIRAKLFYAIETLRQGDKIVVDDNLLLGADEDDFGLFEFFTLPNNLTVKGDLDINGSEIDSLPKNLTVLGKLDVSDTEIETIPSNLKVGGNLILFNTPLGEDYTEKQILKMIEKKGGYVQGEIISY